MLNNAVGLTAKFWSSVHWLAPLCYSGGHDRLKWEKQTGRVTFLSICGGFFVCLLAVHALGTT